MLTSLLTAITAFIAAHPGWAYAAVLLLALSESIPVVGVVVPGTAVIVAISALVPSGAVTLWPILAAAVAGAIIGDGISYWIGHRYQRSILDMPPINRHPALVARAEAFFARHGDKSVLLARFTPGVRAFVPLLAGALGLPPMRFYVANVLSALAWAPAHILPGVLVGVSFGLFGAAAKPLAILLALLIVLIWTTIRALRFVLRRGPPLLSLAVARLRAGVSGRDSRSARFVRDLLDPSRPDGRLLALLACLLIGATWLFLGVLEDVVSGAPLVRADAAVYHALQDLRTKPGDAMMIAITELGDTIVVTAVAAAVFLWLAARRVWRTAAYWLGAVAGASVLNSIIKAALHRARPGELAYNGWSAFSFPSGHSTVNAVLYGMLAFLIAREARPAWRLPVLFGAASFVLLIAFSRIYLGAHWLSDVVAGLAVATAWLTALGLSYLRRPAERIGAAGLAAVASVTLAAAGALNIHRHHPADLERYAVVHEVPVMAADVWWTSGWRQLPARRVDLIGEIEEPFTVQWAGDMASLEAILLDRGWRAPAPWRPLDTLAWLVPDTDLAALPVIPRLASGRLPVRTFVLPHPDAGKESRLVLRLWAADMQLAGRTAAPLWVGSVVEERLHRPFSLLTATWTEPDYDVPRDLLAEGLPSGRLALRAGAAADSGWDRRVLLLRQAAS